MLNNNSIRKKKITHLESPFSRVACSSGVQSRDMPGLCFMFIARPEELSGTEFPLKEEGLTCSWWLPVPDGFAIDNLTLILAVGNQKCCNPKWKRWKLLYLRKFRWKGLLELTVSSRQISNNGERVSE